MQPSRFGSAISASVMADTSQTRDVSMTAARKNASTYTTRYGVTTRVPNR